MKLLLTLFTLPFITMYSIAQSYDCPIDAIGGLPADDIYTVLASYSSNTSVAAQSFINLDTFDFKAISVIGMRHNGDWEECTDEKDPAFIIDFWTYEDLLPGTLLESIDDASLHIDSLDSWTIDNKDWILERFTFTFQEARNYKLGFISIYNNDEAPNNTCKFNWLYNYPDNINLEGATIHDDGTKVIWNAFNFCLLAEGIINSNQNSSNIVDVPFFPNPVEDFLYFENLEDFDQIEIFDALGILHISKDLSANKMIESIDVRDLSSGSFFVRLINSNQQKQITKILIK